MYIHVYTTLTGCVGRKGECSYIQEVNGSIHTCRLLPPSHCGKGEEPGACA